MEGSEDWFTRAMQMQTQTQMEMEASSRRKTEMRKRAELCNGGEIKVQLT